jgi:uncharacterized protein (DUF58 family)
MHLTLRGVLLLLITTPLLIAASWLSLLYWLTGLYALAVVGLLVADWRLAGAPGRFLVQREHEPRLSLGAENPIRLRIENRGRRTAQVAVRDEPPVEFPLDVTVLQGEIAPRQRWEGVYHVRPLRRGDFAFGDLNLRWRGPLGLIVRQARYGCAGPVKVYPNLLDVHRYDLQVRRNRLEELGLRTTRRYGDGTEFERLREYLPDDEFRRIDWKATARRHRPITIEYQTERSQNVMAVIDVGRMMQAPVGDMAKLDYVVNAVLLLTYVATGKGDKVGMMTFAAEVRQFLTPRQGRGQFFRILETLYAIKPEPVEPDYPQALTYFAAKQRKRSLVVIFTDLSGGLGVQALISHVSLLARHSLPLVVTISDPEVVAAAHQLPHDSHSTYERAAAAQLLDERHLVLEQLRRNGVLVLDVPANQLSIAVINRYLELKARTLL